MANESSSQWRRPLAGNCIYEQILLISRQGRSLSKQFEKGLKRAVFFENNSCRVSNEWRFFVCFVSLLLSYESVTSPPDWEEIVGSGRRKSYGSHLIGWPQNSCYIVLVRGHIKPESIKPSLTTITTTWCLWTNTKQAPKNFYSYLVGKQFSNTRIAVTLRIFLDLAREEHHSSGDFWWSHALP